MLQSLCLVLARAKRRNRGLGLRRGRQLKREGWILQVSLYSDKVMLESIYER